MMELIKKKGHSLGVSAGVLKLLAVITMLIDHFAAVWYVYLHNQGYTLQWGMSFQASLTAYNTMRAIGRFSFPIFVFFIVEGFFYTKSRKKYMRNLVVFALISEVPYDYYFLGDFFSIERQNVFFSLALALAAIWILDGLLRKVWGNPIWELLVTIIVLLCIGSLAVLLKVDYTWQGIFLAMIFYLFRNERILACLIAGVVFCYWTPWAFTAFLALLFYNQKRGFQLKYFYYVIYPAHLVIFGLITMLYKG